jgi:hypothetical protein
MEMWILGGVCLLVVFFEGVMKLMVSSNSSAIRKCLMGPGEFIALHLGVVQGRVNPVLRLCMQYEIIVIFLYAVLAVFHGRGLEGPCIASFYRVLFAAL